MSGAEQDGHTYERFSLPLFLLTIGVTLAEIAIIFRVIAPAVWHSEWDAPGWKFGAVYLVLSLVLCFVEFFFHRYVLHQPALPGLGRFYRQHTLHHGLTHIARKPGRDGRGLAGGVCYTGGVTFYLSHRLRYHHAIWHLLVLSGSTFHFLAVLYSVSRAV